MIMCLFGWGKTDVTIEETVEGDPMTAFATTGSNVFFYYEDVEAAKTFYNKVIAWNGMCLRMCRRTMQSQVLSGSHRLRADGNCSGFCDA
jgi:hypothetical protein